MIKKMNIKNQIGEKVLYSIIGLGIAYLISEASIEVLASGINTGFAQLDNGMNKLVGIFKGIVTWGGLIHSMKALLEVTLKGEGSWKNVMNGILVAVVVNLLPFIFNLVTNTFGGM
jgi:hypothetical protein